MHCSKRFLPISCFRKFNLKDMLTTLVQPPLFWKGENIKDKIFPLVGQGIKTGPLIGSRGVTDKNYN
jgi:hypothetical protein